MGKFLIWAGVLTLLFVAHQLWGTNLAEARAQDDLEEDFEQLLDDVGVDTPETDASNTTTTSVAPTTTAAPAPPPMDGEAVAHLVIPKIGVDKIVVEGVSRSDLRKGPGHYPETPMPGQPGNAAIAGHRTTYGAPFNRLDTLAPGDEVLVTTRQGSFRYVVAGTRVVDPKDVTVLTDAGDNRLTLTSCHPEFSARERIVVTAALEDEPAPPTTLPPDVEEPPRTIDALESIDAGENREIAPAILWGSVVVAVWLFFYLLSRRWRRWPAYLLGLPVFAAALFVFYENLSRALPANY